MDLQSVKQISIYGWIMANKPISRNRAIGPKKLMRRTTRIHPSDLMLFRFQGNKEWAFAIGKPLFGNGLSLLSGVGHTVSGLIVSSVAFASRSGIGLIA